MSEYDNTNTGAVFQVDKDKAQIVGTGTLNDEGMENRVCVVKEQQKDGQDVRDIYLKIGRMWINENTKEGSPDVTGIANVTSGEKRVAAWVKQGDYGNMLSLKLTDKTQNANHTQSSVDKTLGSDDIPF